MSTVPTLVSTGATLLSTGPTLLSRVPAPFPRDRLELSKDAKNLYQPFSLFCLQVLGWVNGWAAGGKFMAGTETMTLADLAMLATYSTMEATGVRD